MLSVSLSRTSGDDFPSRGGAAGAGTDLDSRLVVAAFVQRPTSPLLGRGSPQNGAASDHLEPVPPAPRHSEDDGGDEATVTSNRTSMGFRVLPVVMVVVAAMAGGCGVTSAWTSRQGQGAAR